LEKFEMKKTLVAIAAAAVVTGAMAEVTISGYVDVGVGTSQVTSTTGAKTTANSMGSFSNGQSALNFGASEDLGDGMTAFANLNTLPANASAANSAITTDAGTGVGLKGGFGKVFLGSDYNQTFYAMAAADPTWNGGGNGSVWSAANFTGLKSSAAIWTLPSIAQGLNITAESSFAGTSTGVGDATGLGISYTAGGFSATFAAQVQQTLVSTTTGFAVYNGANAATTGAMEGSQASTQVLALSYDLGAAKLYYGAAQTSVNDNGDNAESKWIAGVSVPFGAMSLGYTRSNASFTSAAAAQTTISGDRLIARYTFSKRTSTYLSVGKSSQTSSQIGATVSALGIVHSF